MCRIMTSNYKNCVTENGISISGDRGKRAGFTGPALPELAPKFEFWKVWHNTLGKIPKEASDRYYVREYYKQVLKGLDPAAVLKKIPEGSILLCYETADEFCHRHLVAYWFELFLGISTSEVIENPKRETVRKVNRPEYLKRMLEDVIKEEYDMNDFTIIKMLYEKQRARRKALSLTRTDNNVNID